MSASTRDVGVAPPPPAALPAVALVAGAAPVEVELPSHGVRAPVVPVATQPSGELAIPDPPTTVGWWTPSALPGGSAGTIVLAGHVDSRVAGLGAFAVLRELDAGEPVRVHLSDGRTVTYRVVARQQLPKAELPRELFASGGPPRLVLITCGGRFDRTTRSYHDNVVVYAVP